MLLTYFPLNALNLQAQHFQFAYIPGGCWKNLTDDVQREYMRKSYFMGGGKTGMARRLSYDNPSLTLTCSPAQKQTERCHPEHTRPLQINYI
jgi:DNA (cytosine-5)-methyltransferase 1